MYPSWFTKRGAEVVLICAILITLTAFSCYRDGLFKNAHRSQNITYTLYPSSNTIIPDELRGDKLEFIPPTCFRVISGEWTEDALILRVEHNCNKTPNELSFKRDTSEGTDTIIVKEH